MEKRIEKLEKTTTTLIKYIKGVNETIFGVLETITNNQERLEKQMDVLSTKIDALDGNTTKHFDKVGTKLNGLKSEIQKINKVTGYKDIIDNQKSLGKA